MNLVRLFLKKKEAFGFYQTDQRRYIIKVKATNMTKEQADKFESGIRKASLSILPPKETTEKKP